MTVITQLPDPPSRTTPSQFSARTDAFLGALPGFVTETNAVASEVNADKIIAVNSTAIAVTKAAEATASASTAAIVGTSTKWVSGTSYTEGQGVWSPADLLPYRRLTDGAGTLDPSMDSVNWDPLPPVPMVRVERSSNVEITPADRGHFFDITSGTFSQTFSSKAILGNGFYCYILNSGTGVVTIDPGGLDYALYQKHSLLIQCDGTSLRVVVDSGPRQMRLPIFSPEAATKTAVSVLEDIAFPLYDTLLPASSYSKVYYGNSLFLAHPSVTFTNISTSPDGETWTLRALPSSAQWGIGTNGTNKFIASAYTTTTIAKSTDGVTWTAGTALPTAAAVNPPVFNGNICLIRTSETVHYTSSDNGATWSAAQSMPVSMSGDVYSIGGLFWTYVSGTTAYTSPTGATGTWTLRTLPFSNYVGRSYTITGNLCSYSAYTGYLSYETSDGINWVSTGITSPPSSNTPGLVINGVRTWSATTLPGAMTIHNGNYVQRISTFPFSTADGCFATNGTIIVFANVSGTPTSKVSVFNPATGTPTAIFEG